MDSADGAPTLADDFEARFLRHSPDLHESTSVLQFLHDQQPSVLLLAQRRREEDNADSARRNFRFKSCRSILEKVPA